MKETKTNFLKDVYVNSDYYKTPTPYVNAPSCNVDFLELSRYAKRVGKKLVELTQEEVKQFTLL